RRRTRIVGALLREAGEVLVRLDARQQVGGLLVRGFTRLRRGVGRDLDEDVPGVDLLRLGEAVLLVELVVLGDLAVGRLDARRELVRPVRDEACTDGRRGAV